MQRFFYLFLVVGFLFAGCQEADQSDDKQPASSEPISINKDIFKPISQMDNSKAFSIDTTKSQITWRCENHKGLVDLNSGSIFVRKGEPVGAYTEAITKSARDTSIAYKLMQGTFNNVLQTADFFDGAHYPLLKFGATKIKKQEDQYIVDGELSIRNIIRPIQFKLTSFREKGGKITLETEEIPINRTLFGMELNSRSFPKKAKDFIFSDTFFIKIFLVTKGD